MSSISDTQLMGRYKSQPSVNQRLINIRRQLEDVMSIPNDVDVVMEVITPFLVQAGVKGVVRGLELNQLVKKRLEDHFQHPTYFIRFKQMCPDYITSEKPDWWIKNNETGRCVIGFNQIDLWSGGAQCNRGDKYLSHHFHEVAPPHVRILSVVCSALPDGKGTYFDKVRMAFSMKRLCHTGAMLETINNLLAL